MQQNKLFPETKRFIIARQNQVITTKNDLKHMIKSLKTQNDKYRKYKQFSEIIDHITGECKLLADKIYRETHGSQNSAQRNYQHIQHRTIHRTTPVYTNNYH